MVVEVPCDGGDNANGNGDGGCGCTSGGDGGKEPLSNVGKVF